jgi:hypothetical protein
MDELGKPVWPWPLQIERYDRTGILYPIEVSVLANWASAPGILDVEGCLARLVQPLSDALEVLQARPDDQREIIRALICEMNRRQSAFWAWSRLDWADIFCQDGSAFTDKHGVQSRQLLIAVIYLLCDISDIHTIPKLYSLRLARMVFGADVVGQGVQRVNQELIHRAYEDSSCERVRQALGIALLFNRSPYLEILTTEILAVLKQSIEQKYIRKGISTLAKVLFNMQVITTPLARAHRPYKPSIQKNTDVRSVSTQWEEGCQRWYEEKMRLLSQNAEDGHLEDSYTHNGETILRSPLPNESTTQYLRVTHSHLLKVGLWLAQECPGVIGPDQWDRRVAAKFVGAVSNLVLGEWCYPGPGQAHRVGQEASARTKLRYLRYVRAFFADLQRWGWIAYNLNPDKDLRSPTRLLREADTAPEPIPDEVWHKLLKAGLELTASDLPTRYPFEMTRALALVWLFSGLYATEMYRLRTGCIQQCNDGYFIDVPTKIQGETFPKRIARSVAEAILRWKEVRPQQGAVPDKVTGEENVEFLFIYQDRPISDTYIHQVIIPALCRKADVAQHHPLYGGISTFRARVTIALALLDEIEGMTDLELHAWLHNKHIQTTFHLLRARSSRPGAVPQTPVAYDGTLVLDRVQRGDVADLTLKMDDGQARPDLGPGRCAHPFHDECRNSTAFSQHGLYDPHDTLVAQIFAARADLKRIRQQVSMTNQQITIIEQGIALMDRLGADRMDTG